MDRFSVSCEYRRVRRCRISRAENEGGREVGRAKLRGVAPRASDALFSRRSRERTRALFVSEGISVSIFACLKVNRLAIRSLRYLIYTVCLFIARKMFRPHQVIRSYKRILQRARVQGTYGCRSIGLRGFKLQSAILADSV